MVDWTADLHDFADTAALIHNLDRIITVDTAVAHLAGAMGKPLDMLLPFIPDWRWLLDRPDTPWYPTMHLHRQPTPSDWRHPIANLVNRRMR
jgi:ADP-heptose:LPS heptosyltransferase